jgi:hypothetical protein
MRWKAASAPRRRSSRPASSAVIRAASCCNASRFCRKISNCACCVFRLLSVCACSASRRAASSALFRNRLVSLRAHPCCAPPAPATPACAARCAALGFHLFQSRAQVGRLALRMTPLLAARFKLLPSAPRSRASALRRPSPRPPVPAPVSRAGLRSRAARASAPAALRSPACRPSPSSDESTRPPA